MTENFEVECSSDGGGVLEVLRLTEPRPGVNYFLECWFLGGVFRFKCLVFSWLAWFKIFF